eukprot:6195451-Pleurochrysis_carterae.AAC.1
MPLTMTYLVPRPSYCSSSVLTRSTPTQSWPTRICAGMSKLSKAKKSRTLRSIRCWLSAPTS